MVQLVSDLADICFVQLLSLFFMQDMRQFSWLETLVLCNRSRGEGGGGLGNTWETILYSN